MNILKDIRVSCFKDYKSPNTPKDVDLLQWLHSHKYKVKVERIRSTTDKKERDRLKAQLPAITPSGIFSKRAKGALVQHSGFICIDIDYKGNEHLGNFHDLKAQLSHIKNVAYCGLSVSGQGYFVLIPLLYPQQHESQFLALEQDFRQFGIAIDAACKDVSRLRGYSYDNRAYFNYEAIPYEKVYTSEIKGYNRTYSTNTTTTTDWTKNNVEALIVRLEAKRIDVTYEYNTWLAIAFGFASHFGESGRDYFHRVSQFYPDYRQLEVDRKFNSALSRRSSNNSLGAFFNACKAHNITYK